MRDRLSTIHCRRCGRQAGSTLCAAVARWERCDAPTRRSHSASGWRRRWRVPAQEVWGVESNYTRDASRANLLSNSDGESSYVEFCMPTSNSTERLVPIDRLRVCGVGELEPGELFVSCWGRTGSRLALLGSSHEQRDGARFAVWLSDEAGHLTAPSYDRIETAGELVASFGRTFEFVVDPLDPHNRIDRAPGNIEGAALFRMQDRVALRAQSKSIRLSDIIIDVRTGLLLPAGPAPTISFASWTLRLQPLQPHQAPVVLGRLDARATLEGAR